MVVLLPVGEVVLACGEDRRFGIFFSRTPSAKRKCQNGYPRRTPNRSHLGVLPAGGYAEGGGRAMDEVEWLACQNPEAMLHCARIALQPRKVKLCGAAFGRCVWDALPGDALRRLVELGEAEADGLCAPEELADALASLLQNQRHFLSDASLLQDPLGWVAQVAARLVDLAAYAAITKVQQVTPIQGWLTALPAALALAHEKTRSALCGVIRDVFNPFHPITLDPACLTPTVASLAHAAYSERILPSGELDPLQLAVLADALEEAGAAADLVEHLRANGPHVRGCWALDLLHIRR
jgi:hypothetical protein